ncbi:LysR family transcriptional regulator [Paraburkholderia aspalathi]|uniref:DNA-binding transcriptional regulator, LysR family n=1 Tax=Paraburkholderia aspalathi TaxID=1324617 RepID=A0A1I7ERM3_9BURK|nr:LysR family transcriptional regulator [Paraburkholderia aspalathi]SFU26564.1 DNA-binding transcriptional regulator, LysR family [Paraburkholderia aspalathi]
MDRLRCIEVFIEVAHAASFSVAAQRLAMSKGNVTKHVAWLEQNLGMQLLSRTTKSVSLTEAGMTLLETGQTLLEQMSDMEGRLRNSVGGTRGVLRVGTQPSFGAYHLVPVVTAFAESHPDVQVLLKLDDGSADLVSERLDLTIRIAPELKDTSYVAIKLARVPQYLVASPRYLSQRGMPASIDDLDKHDCLVNTRKSSNGLWIFESTNGPRTVRPEGSVRANFGEPLLHAARLGHGISMHPLYMIDDDLASGELVIVLPESTPIGLDIYAMYPSRRHLPSRVRTFIDFLREQIGGRQNWSETRSYVQQANASQERIH